MYATKINFYMKQSLKIFELFAGNPNSFKGNILIVQKPVNQIALKFY